MKSSTLIAIGISLYASAGLASEMNELSVKPLNRVWSELTNDKKALNIMAESIYSNSCYLDKEIYKSKAESNSQISYRVYRSVEEGKNCIKVFQPVERVYMIDQIPMDKLSEVKSITVNGQVL